MDASRDLRGRFLRLTAVNVLSNITVPLAGLVDTAMLGHLDEIRFLAGVALASVLFDYVYWTFGVLRMGTTGMTAQAVGAGDRERMFAALYRFGLVGLVSAAGLLLLQWPLREAGFALLLGSPAVESAGRDYFDARIWGAPATLLNLVLLGWFLGRAESRKALWMTVAANIANIGLNWLFIIRLGWAARGAGLATMLAQYVSLLVALALMRGVGARPPLRAGLAARREDWATLLRLNRDLVVRTLCLISAFAVFINVSSVLGTTLLAANAILFRLLNMAAYVIDGGAFATETLAGTLHGAGDRGALRRLVRFSLLFGAFFATLALTLHALFPRPIYAALTSHGDVIETALTYGPWLIPCLGFGALAYMLDGVFLGLTAGRTLRNAMWVSLVLVFVPLAWVAYRLASNHLLWSALSAFMAARALTLTIPVRKLCAAGDEP